MAEDPQDAQASESPPADLLTHPDDPTERGEQRHQEDLNYVPVIIKRTDEYIRHPDDILQYAIEEGLEQLRRAPLSLWLSALAGGLFVGFTAMAVAVITTLEAAGSLPLPARLATALVYPFGFVVCLMSGTELFTEHTATAVYPVLDRKASAVRMVRLWALVLVGNLMGALASAGLLVLADPVIGARVGYEAVAQHLAHVETLPLLTSALLAGWLMALAGWLMLGTPPASAQILSIYIVTFLIGLGGLHHSIAGSAEMFTALLIGDAYDWGQGLRFVGLAVTGNLVGGSVFVAVLNYGHIRKTQQDA